MPMPSTVLLVQLLTQSANKNSQAFEQLYKLTAPYIFAVIARILIDRKRAEDVLQEVFITVWQCAADYDVSKSAPLTWLTAISRNRAFDVLRQHKSAPMDSLEDQAMDHLLNKSETLDSLDILILSCDSRDLELCIQKLPSCQRQALALAFYRGLSHPEIADCLQVPLGTAKAWVRRGLEEMKAHLLSIQ